MYPVSVVRAALVTAAILVVGCSSNHGQLEGTKWTSRPGTVKGRTIPAGVMELEFKTDGTLQARNGFRRLSGTYSLGWGDAVVLSFNEALNGRKEHAERITIDGEQLSMTDSDGAAITFQKSNSANVWRAFGSEAGKFSVLTPGELVEQVQPQHTLVGDVDSHMFECFSDGGEYVATYNDFPRLFSWLADPAKELEGARNGVVAALKGKLTGDAKIELDGHPGREFTFEGNAPDGTPITVKSRIYAVGNRLYQIFVSAARGDLPASSTDKFLKSFKLQKE